MKDDELVIRTDGQERTVGAGSGNMDFIRSDPDGTQEVRYTLKADGNWEQPAPPTTFEVGASDNVVATSAPDILAVRADAVAVIRIAHDGRLFWHGREVTTDDDFRAAMLYLAEWLRTPVP